VRTTREPGTEETAAAILSGGLSGTARTEASSSLLTSTIVNYLGGPADTQAPEDIPASTEEFPEDARTAYAAEPVGQKPSEVALEYILMTFGGALAAASAIRLFVV
jgi:hypothetical protein